MHRYMFWLAASSGGARVLLTADPLIANFALQARRAVWRTCCKTQVRVRVRARAA